MRIVVEKYAILSWNIADAQPLEHIHPCNTYVSPLGKLVDLLSKFLSDYVFCASDVVVCTYTPTRDTYRPIVLAALRPIRI